MFLRILVIAHVHRAEHTGISRSRLLPRGRGADLQRCAVERGSMQCMGDSSCIGFTFKFHDREPAVPMEDVVVNHHPEVQNDSGAGDKPLHLAGVLAGREISDV